MNDKYKIVDSKGKHLFDKRVFNSFLETYNFLEKLTNYKNVELFVIPTTWENFKGRGNENDSK
tara:strand:+ start:69 stop:257 length:189 start_codon:yes stop_codon:yes gene_type:complete